VYELQDHLNHVCSTVTGSFCQVLTMVAHRKVSAESFDNLLLLVNFYDLLSYSINKSPGAFDYLLQLPPFPTVSACISFHPFF
jgi:hypothetical protein